MLLLVETNNKHVLAKTNLLQLMHNMLITEWREEGLRTERWSGIDGYKDGGTGGDGDKLSLRVVF